MTELAEGDDQTSGDAPRACYALAVLLASKRDEGGRERGRKGGRRQEEEEREYRLLSRAVRGGVLPAVHNLANVLAQGHG